MSLTERIQNDMTAAMRARDERRLSTLRLARTALKNREIEKRGPLPETEEVQVLATLIKQRRDSIEQFRKGGRDDLADKEAAEITILEAYMPQAAGDEEIAATVRSVIAEMKEKGTAPTQKDMGQVMKAVMARFQAEGKRADGKTVSETVKRELGS